MRSDAAHEVQRYSASCIYLTIYASKIQSSILPNFSHFNMPSSLQAWCNLTLHTQADICLGLLLPAGRLFCLPSGHLVAARESVFVDAQDAHFVHAWKLCYHQHQQHDQVQPQRLPPAQINMRSRRITHAQMHQHPIEPLTNYTSNVSEAVTKLFLACNIDEANCTAIHKGADELQPAPTG